MIRIAFCLLVLGSGTLFAQNLIYNPSFEEYTECPKRIDPLGVLTIVEAWYQPTSGSADYYNKCGSRECNIPNNKLGSQYPRTGVGMCGIYCSKPDYREYMQTELKQPLIQGERYRLTYYVSLSEYSSGAIATLGGMFSNTRALDDTKGILRFKNTEAKGNRITQTHISNFEPQVFNPYDKILDDITEWMKIEGEFVAQGGERFLTIGNFFTTEQSNYVEMDTLTMLLQGAYYYIDDVEVVHVKKNTGGTDLVVQEENIRDTFAFTPKVGVTYVLENIFFDFDRSKLLQQSYVELQKLLSLLELYPRIKLEISGHTDSKGSIDYNQRLSEERAQSVVAYLVKKGIQQERLKYKGYGKRKPITTNDTKEGREKNRRVEFTILSM